MSDTPFTPSKDAIAEALANLTAQLAAGNSDALTAYLAAASRFHNYSFGNIMLIAVQKPDASKVAGFHAWKSLGRSVKKGEKAIRILAPMVVGKKDSEDSKGTVIGFRAVCVFDVSQTEGADLPSINMDVAGRSDGMLERLTAFAESQSIRVSFVADLGGALGVSKGGVIELLAGEPGGRVVATLIHELAHELLHRQERKTKVVRELEAEAVAFVVGSNLGLQMNTSSADYIRLYNGDADLLAESLEAITKASTAILKGVAVAVSAGVAA